MATSKRKPAYPILPTDPRDPEGTNGPVSRAEKEFRRRIKQCVKLYVDVIDRFPRQVIQVNAERYVYQLDQGVLKSLLESIGWLVDEIMQEGGEPNLWFWTDFVKPAYERGTAKAIKNIARQSPAYRAERATLADVITLEPYQRRLILLRAREFEEMKHLTSSIKADMARILTDGMARGRNPLDIARNLQEQTEIEDYRARRIARTEINTALRRARWDEFQDAQQEYGLNMKVMHISALGPTTRRTHAARHGNLYTVEQSRDWFAQGSTSINCRCSTVEVMVDNDGKPLVPAIEERAHAMRKKFEEKQDAAD
ncbi:MAG: hypothetical protein [Caudoviricetes sp.]|nr:MAG: hypothetical protein [Caudoviricetes sp.]